MWPARLYNRRSLIKGAASLMDPTDEDEQEGFGDHVVLERTGSPPIKFRGKLVAEGSTTTEKKDDRGYCVRIYETRTAAGATRHVMQVEYLTKWKSEANGYVVLVADSEREVAIKLLSFNPMYFVVGYPPGERFFEKRQRLETTLRFQYIALISRLLTQIPGAAVALEDVKPDPPKEGSPPE